MKKWIAALLLAALALTLSACGGKKAETPAAEVKLADVLAEFGTGDEMLALTEEDMADIYGIEAADMKQFAACVNSTGIKADEIVLVEAADAAAAARVKEALDNRFQSKLNELDGYLPEEFAVAKACKVEARGNFVSMIVAPNAADLEKAFGERVK